MAVFFWYLVISDLSSVYYCTRVHWTSHIFQGTRNTQQCITGDPVTETHGHVLLVTQYQKHTAMYYR